MEGDTIWHSFPPPDTVYVHDRIAIKFKRGILNTDSLCYNCDAIVEMRTKQKGVQPLSDSSDFYNTCMENVLAQRFSVAIISDPVVRSILSANGVSYLKRMTWANPCADTLSLSRFGDTIPMDDFDWMIAYFNNDSSIIPTLTELYLTYNGSVQDAEPDFYWSCYTKTPADPMFGTAPQTSLHMIGMDEGQYQGTPINGAWQYAVGDNNIAIAVVDHGVDFWRCDLGGATPESGNPKVVSGFGWMDNSIDGMADNAWHGTDVASIIGALTNNTNCNNGAPTPTLIGMAGIGGGWGTAGVPAPPSQGTGVIIIGYNTIEGLGLGAPLDEMDVARSIMQAGAHSLNSPYGNSVDVINFSAGANYEQYKGSYSPFVRNSIAEAFANGVSFVAAKGDANNNTIDYPSDHEPASEIIAVASSDQNKIRYTDSKWGNHTDMLAPGADGLGDGLTPVIIPNTNPAQIDVSLNFDPGDSPSASSGNEDQFSWFGATSAAAPNVSGVVGLLKGYLKDNDIAFAREDVEGILKASADDIVTSPPIIPSDPDGTNYITGFDDRTGWGFLNAARMFQMLDPAGPDAYQLFHFEIHNSDLSFGSWSNKVTNQTFYTPTPTSTTPIMAQYDVKWREVTATISYSGHGINTSKNVYAWGNSGVGAGNYGVSRGLANLLPNWGEPWCDVTSGQLGNQGVTLNTGKINVGVPGFRHEYSTSVSVHTYQYDLYTPGGGSELRMTPVTTSMGMGITVFGATKSSSGVKMATNPMSLTVSPNPSLAYLDVTFEEATQLGQFVLTDVLGRTVREMSVLPGMSRVEVPTSDLPSGIYIGRLIIGENVQNANIVIQH